MSRRPTDCNSKPTPEPSVLDAGRRVPASSLTLTAATENKRTRPHARPPAASEPRASPAPREGPAPRREGRRSRRNSTPRGRVCRRTIAALGMEAANDAGLGPAGRRGRGARGEGRSAPRHLRSDHRRREEHRVRQAHSVGIRPRIRAGAARKGCSGAPDRIRTCDLRLRRPTLYPLSYRRARNGV